MGDLLPLLDGSTSDWLLWLAVGTTVGFVKWIALGFKSLKLLLLDIGAGIAGAVPAAWFMLPFSTVSDPHRLHKVGLTGAFIGAFLLVLVLASVTGIDDTSRRDG